MKTAIIITFIITAILYLGGRLLIAYISSDAFEVLRIKYNQASVKAEIAGLMIMGSYVSAIVLIVLILIFLL
jgi:hypothetical protein